MLRPAVAIARREQDNALEAGRSGQQARPG